MGLNFRDFADRAAADGAISPDELLALRRAGWGDGRMSEDEAEAIFAANDALTEPDTAWSDFFVEAIGEYVVNQLEPKGYVTQAQGAWLVERVARDGKLDSVTELELLVRVLERAEATPEALKAFALAQIERAVVSGEGPTRDGGALQIGVVNAAEASLLRRILFASGGDRPAAVSRPEAELLYRLKDAAAGSANAPEWKTLFVQGVANFIEGYQAHAPLSRERAAELEAAMNDNRASVGRFFGRMLRSSPADGLRWAVEGDGAERDRFAEMAADAQVTADEAAWLAAHNDADGKLDDLEQALLDFLATR